MTTLLPVTLISGSYLISFNEPKVVCVPQRGKLSIGTLSHASYNVYFCSFDLIECVYINELNAPRKLHWNHSSNSFVESTLQEVRLLVLISMQNLESHLAIIF